MVLPAVTACGPTVATTGSFSFSSSAHVLASSARRAVRDLSFVIALIESLLPGSRSGSALNPGEQRRVLGRLRSQHCPAAMALSRGLHEQAACLRVLDVDEPPRRRQIAGLVAGEQERATG